MSIKKENSKADFISIEHDILNFWEKNDIFQKLIKQNSKGKKWSFLDGPITANNPMGVHHAWGRTLKDVYQRYKAMNGYQLRYQNGFDCQGLWVEVEVEKELGIKSKKEVEDLGIEKFVNLCKKRVQKYSEVQTDQSKRLGYWMDWDNSYYTMSDDNNYAIWSFLKKLFEKDKIYRGTDVVPWSGRSGTSYSQMEIIEGRKLTVHKGVFVKFPLKNHKNENLLIWTTTPWTLSSNIAVAINTKLNYAKISIPDGSIYYVAENNLKFQRLAKEFSEKKNWVKGIPKLKTLDQIFKERGGYKIIEVLKGKDMLGWNYEGPYDHLDAQNNNGGYPNVNVELEKKGVNAVQCHVIVDGGKDSEGNDMVIEGEGTGIVHMAGGCGSIDNKICKKNGFVEISPIDNQANFVEGFDFLSGLNATDEKTSEKILQDLKKRNLLLYAEDYPHVYPHCWRSGDELVFKQVNEWYINMDWRDRIKNVVDEADWIPEWGSDSEHNWLDNMGDWMISKKRFWGLALPIWTFEDGSFYVVGSKEELEKLAVEGWDKFKGNSPHRPWIDYVKIKHPETGLVGIRIEDVGNPWLDAGIVPFSTLGYFDNNEYWKEWFPADFITECFPGQFRNWFYSLLAMSSFLEDKAPFKTLLGHALVKDEDGKEMHKTAGNAIWFDDAAEKMGVDVMRWMYIRQNVENNLLFGYSKADDVRKRLINFWNIYSFFCTYANVDKFEPDTQKINPKDYTLLDKWIIAKVNLLIKESSIHYDRFEADKLLKKIELFIDDLSNWYIRRNRRRFWKSENDKDKFVAYQTLYEVLLSVIKILSPILPFVTEHMYKNISKEKFESVHLSPYPDFDEKKIGSELLKKVDVLKKVMEGGRAARKKANVKVRQPLSEIKIYENDSNIAEFIMNQKEIILDELNIKKITITDQIEMMGSFTIKPNFKTLSSKFGENMQEIVKIISTMDEYSTIKKYLHNEKLFSEDFDIINEDIIVQIKGAKGEEAFFSNNVIISINTEIDDDLKTEGLVREVIRHIQIMRKEANFDVDDRIILSNNFSDEIASAIEKHKQYFMNEILCTDIVDKLENSDYNSLFSYEKNDFSIFIKKQENK